MTLTLPGSIPGLLRRGSPVLWRDESTPYTALWVGPWPDSDSVEDGALVLAYPCTGPLRLGVEDTGSNFALDLTDATGRAHAAWWLGGHGPPRFVWRFGRHVLFDVRSAQSWVVTRHGQHRGEQAVVPSLADLDPNDPRTLPDGSRWVDAEALRRVVLHVAGVTP